MSTTISISKELDLYFLGRNGSGHMCGAAIFPYGHVLDIRPITSKGRTGRCSLSIPLEQTEEFIEALRSAARELQPSSAEPISASASGTAFPDCDQLIAQFGAWGEHPNHPRSDWQYLVANGDTQRGYWEHVLEGLEQTREDSHPAGIEYAK